jgi:hypothetical protein
MVNLKAMQAELEIVDRKQARLLYRKDKTKTRRYPTAKTINPSSCTDEFDYAAIETLNRANLLSRRLGKSLTFRAKRTEEGDVICHVYEGKKFVTELELPVFQHENRPAISGAHSGHRNAIRRESEPVHRWNRENSR